MHGPDRGQQPRRILGDLGRRVLGAMILISLVPLIIVAYQGYHCARQAIVENAEEHLLSVLSSRKSALEEWLRERLNDIELLASVPSVSCQCSAPNAGIAGTAATAGAAGIAAVCTCLDAVRIRSQSYERLTVYDREWRPIAATGGREVEQAPPELRAAIGGANGVYVDAPRSLPNGSIGLRIGRSVREPADRRVGAVVAEIDLGRSLTQLLQDRSGLGATGKVYIAEQDLTLVTEPFQGGEPVALRAAANPAVAEIARGAPPPVREYTDILGKHVLGSAVEVPLLRWILVAEQDAGELLGWLGTLRTRALATGLVTMLVVIALAFWLSARLASPLRELARVANRIREGNREERVGPLAGEEAEEVRSGFNRMMDELDRIQGRLVQSATLASVGELSSRIVHEMRNPLSSVKMNLQALARKVRDDPVDRELAELASDQVARIESMLTDLLTYGRPVELDIRPTPFGELARDALEVVSPLASERGVTVTVAGGARGGDPLLAVDRELMCRALSNLLLNAIQAAPAGGAVEVRALPAGHVASGEGGVAIEVLDNGPGLAPEVREHLFKPFFTTKERGTGLGLANVKKIVELHGGSIAAADRPEGGAAFRIALPAGVPQHGDHPRHR